MGHSRFAVPFKKNTAGLKPRQFYENRLNGTKFYGKIRAINQNSEGLAMEYRCKVTVIDKKLFPELQAQYCAVPDSGKCPCYHVGDEFLFYRNDERDDYWHCGEGSSPS